MCGRAPEQPGQGHFLLLFVALGDSEKKWILPQRGGSSKIERRPQRNIDFPEKHENGRRGAKARFKNTDNCKSKRSVRIPQEVAILPQRGDGSEIERRPQRSGHFQKKNVNGRRGARAR